MSKYSDDEAPWTNDTQPTRRGGSSSLLLGVLLGLLIGLIVGALAGYTLATHTVSSGTVRSVLLSINMNPAI